MILADINDPAGIVLGGKPADYHADQSCENVCYLSEIEDHDDTSTNVSATKSGQAIR